mmetsp:Transcript_36180/g.91051  ORF Transcript_36180/g.91051 Transcript_36180/m.91051 type:complete len:264 (-) Transcript_36180:406-1197(-)
MMLKPERQHHACCKDCHARGRQHEAAKSARPFATLRITDANTPPTFRHRGVCPPCDGISDADDCIVGPLRAAEDLPMHHQGIVVLLGAEMLYFKDPRLQHRGEAGVAAQVIVWEERRRQTVPLHDTVATDAQERLLLRDGEASTERIALARDSIALMVKARATTVPVQQDTTTDFQILCPPTSIRPASADLLAINSDDKVVRSIWEIRVQAVARVAGVLRATNGKGCGNTAFLASARSDVHDFEGVLPRSRSRVAADVCEECC